MKQNLRTKLAIVLPALLLGVVLATILAVFLIPKSAYAAGSCPVGANEGFDGTFYFKSGTAFEMTFSQAITANRAVVFGDYAGEPTINTAAQTLTNKTLTAPDINAGTVDAITSLTPDTDLAFIGARAITTSAGDLTLAPTFDLILNDGKNFIGDTVNTKMTAGLTINQGANTDESLALKNSGDAHPFTTEAEADTQLMFMRFFGGASIQGFSQTGTGRALILSGAGNTPDTTKSTAGSGAIEIRGYGGAGPAYGNMGADGNIVAIRNNTTTVWIVDEDGDTWQAGDASLANLNITSFASDWTNAGRTVADLGIVTTADIRGGTIGPVTVDDTITFGENSLVLDHAIGTDQKWSGVTIGGTGGEVIDIGELCYLQNTDNEWLLTNADTEAQAAGMLGIAISAGTNGNPFNLLLQGFMREDTLYNFPTGGAPLFISVTPGAMSETAPVGAGDIVRIVGYAHDDADTIYFNPGATFVEIAP